MSRQTTICAWAERGAKGRESRSRNEESEGTETRAREQRHHEDADQSEDRRRGGCEVGGLVREAAEERAVQREHRAGELLVLQIPRYSKSALRGFQMGEARVDRRLAVGVLHRDLRNVSTSVVPATFGMRWTASASKSRGRRGPSP
jgi:hypothetical protein